MSVKRVSLSVFGAIGILSIVLAVATVWLALTNPVTVAIAVDERDISPFVRELAQVLLDALKGLLRFL